MPGLIWLDEIALPALLAPATALAALASRVAARVLTSALAAATTGEATETHAAATMPQTMLGCVCTCAATVSPRPTWLLYILTRTWPQVRAPASLRGVQGGV